MSLEGSLETIALPEVLQLLSDTSKSGELLVRGDRGEGRLWFDAGRLSGFDVARCGDAADALFELLRQSNGRFAFDAGTERPQDANVVGEGDGGDVRPVLDVAEARLEEWTGIVAVVPSLDHVVSLSSEAPADDVTLSAAQWSLVVTIGEGRPVGSVLDRAGLSEFEGCRSLKTLVEAGLASLAEPAAVADVEAVPEDVSDSTYGLDSLLEADAEAGAEPVAEVATLASFEMDAQPDAASEHEGLLAESPQAESPQVVVNGGTFDGHDFVFKAPSQLDADDYEPQPVPYPEIRENGHAPYDAEADEVEADGSMDSRAALEALLAEIPGDESATASEDGGHEGEFHDGLADRGPWTSQELASFDQMGGWDGGEPEAAAHEYDFSHVEDQPETAPVSEYSFEGADDVYSERSSDGAEQVDDEDGAADEEPQDAQPEHVNRGLLLKFLSSVRS